MITLIHARILSRATKYSLIQFDRIFQKEADFEKHWNSLHLNSGFGKLNAALFLDNYFARDNVPRTPQSK